ncbi:MAG: ABC transporter permease [Butyrivibrio sp.]|nr:ABC transporter permease [Butyrivibrio sp.]
MFFAQGTSVTEDKIKEIRYNIDKAMIEDSLTDAESDEDSAVNWIDCYSSVGTISASANKKTVEATAIGTGGEFFLFHPLYLLAGSYYNSDDLMNDKVVIDENLAWQLYGSSDIIGQTIEISGVPHIIAGVTKMDNDKMTKAAGVSGAYCFLSYSSLYNYGTVTGVSFSNVGSSGEEGDLATSDPGAISCYEVVMPNPVDGYARSVLAGKIGFKEPDIQTVDNTLRYGFINLINVLNNFSTRSMRTFNVTYPYWENIARGWEDILSLIMLVRFICIVFVLAILVWRIVYGYRHKKWTAEGVWQDIKDRKYDLECKIHDHREKWKHF